MKVPLPVLVSPPVPEITPEKTVLVKSPPVVRAAAPSRTLPAPESEPMVWSKSARSSVAPAATFVALSGEKVPAAPACSVPWLTKVAPK